jgi:uncharacterized membrane protein
MSDISAVGVIAIWGCLALASGLIAALLAAYKDRSYSAWAFWSLLFPPALWLLFVLPKLNVGHHSVERHRNHEED